MAAIAIIESRTATARETDSASRLGAPTVDCRYCATRTFDAAKRRKAESWLSPRERAELAAWREPGRRSAWLMARMLGKQLIGENLADAVDPATVEILSRDAAGRSVRPRIWRGGGEQPWSLSITHTARGALAALCVTRGVRLGIDITDCDNLSDGFTRLWFTPAEQRWLRATDCPSIACFIWAAKEAVYKACNEGEGFAPRDVEVLGHNRYAYRQMPLAGCRVKSWTIDGQLAVIVQRGDNQT